MVVIALVVLSILKLKNGFPSALFGLAVVLVADQRHLGHPVLGGFGRDDGRYFRHRRRFSAANIKATKNSRSSTHRRNRCACKLLAQRSKSRRMPIEEVVVGDLVTLDMGDEIPADGRLIRANELYIDQSLMTGRIRTVRKTVRAEDEIAEGPDQAGCLYRGTQVVDGAAQMVVTEVGDMTMIGQIARRLSADDEEPEEAEADQSESSESASSEEADDFRKSRPRFSRN